MTTPTEKRPAVVVVGASRGIGRAVAKVAARDHAVIVLVGRAVEGLAEAAADVRQAGAKALSLQLDVAAAGAVAKLQAYLDANDLYCEVLVNSAGFGLRGPASVLPVTDQIGIIDVNVRALSEFTLHFLPEMVRRGQGGVINIGSVAGFTPGPSMAMYYASKSFVRSFSYALHQELRGSGVMVTCVAPGPVATDFLRKSGANRAFLFKALPKLTADYVAERAWRGFKAGRRVVIPGASAKLTAMTASLLPSAVMLPLIAKLQRRSGDQLR